MNEQPLETPGGEPEEPRRASGEYFRAPWGNKLKVVTIAFAIVGLFLIVQGGSTAVVVLLVIALVAAVVSVRGYGVEAGRLSIYHLGWASRYDLSRLVSVEVLSGGLPGSLRLFGVGGLFAFSGRFWHPDLGSYRAYATDGSRSVLLDFGDERILVTPDSPRDFAAAVRLQSHYRAA